jgi:hypothetical protein
LAKARRVHVLQQLNLRNPDSAKKSKAVLYC